MKKILTYILILMFVVINVQAAAKKSSNQELTPKQINKIILKIRKNFNVVNSNIKKYRLVKIELEEPSEGGELIAYYNKKNKLVKMSISYCATLGQLTRDFYFKNGKLFFVYTEDYQYNMPFYMKGFSFKKSSKFENRYYFSNGKLIRWLEKKNKPASVPDKYGLTESRAMCDSEVIGEMHECLELLNKKNKKSE